MPTTPEGFRKRLDDLRADIVRQGLRVRILVEESFDNVFSPDRAALERLDAQEDEVDRVDVAIEREAVALLADATELGNRLSDDDLRVVLAIVKVNNELERIADVALRAAALGGALNERQAACPPTFRVMTNSVVGVVRDAVKTLETSDAALARVVLQSDDAIEDFKTTLVREAERIVAKSGMPPGPAFVMVEVAHACQTIAEHAVNIAEQIIYLHTGRIIRHMEGKWQEVQTEADPPA